MLPPLIELEPLSEWLGVELDAESSDGARAQAAIEAASSRIRAEVARDWVDDEGDLDFGDMAQWAVDVVREVCLAVAARAYQNPNGTTQTSVGDVSVSFTREGNAGAVYLTKDDRRKLRQAVGSPGYGSVGMETPYMRGGGGPYYVEVEGGGDMLPIGPFPWEAH